MTESVNTKINSGSISVRKFPLHPSAHNRFEDLSIDTDAQSTLQLLAIQGESSRILDDVFMVMPQ